MSETFHVYVNVHLPDGTDPWFAYSGVNDALLVGRLTHEANYYRGSTADGKVFKRATLPLLRKSFDEHGLTPQHFGIALAGTDSNGVVLTTGMLTGLRDSLSIQLSSANRIALEAYAQRLEEEIMRRLEPTARGVQVSVGEAKIQSLDDDERNGERPIPASESGGNLRAFFNHGWTIATGSAIVAGLVVWLIASIVTSVQ